MARLTKKPNSESVQARLALAAYYRGLYLKKPDEKFLKKANEHLAYAREKLAPDDAGVLLFSADIAQLSKNVGLRSRKTWTRALSSAA